MKTLDTSTLLHATKRLLLGAAMLSWGWAVPARGAAQEATATLRGVVFDSTRMKPLSGARVAVLGTSAVVDVDQEGRFELSGIPSGAYWVSFFHPRLQELGVSAPSTQITFQGGGATEIVLAVPSERTLLMGWCMAEQTGPARASLAGVVTDSLTGAPLPGAVVSVQFAEHRRGDPPPVEAHTDEAGYYRLCDVPAEREVVLEARSEGNAERSDRVTLPAGDAQIHDLMLPVSTERSRVGEGRDRASGRPPLGATASVLESRARNVAAADGGFELPGLPSGRRPVGKAPAAGYADVFTRAEIEPLLGRVSNLGDLLRSLNAPGLSVREVRMADGVTGVVVPGLCVEVDRRSKGSPGCAQAAIRVNDVTIPNPDQFLMNLDPASIDRIEILGAEDAQIEVGAMAGNGAVLIYTR